MTDTRHDPPQTPRKRPCPGKQGTPNKKAISDSNRLVRQTLRNPIVVLLTPIRRAQGRILERNLKDAGANLLSVNNKDVDEPPSYVQLLVVTDDLRKARARLESGTLAHIEARYISVKWATTVLAAQDWVPFEGFALSPDEAKSTTSTSNPCQSTVQTGTVSPPIFSVSAPPVWCSRGVNESSDIAEKSQFMTSLPAFPCQRCTITQTIHPAPNRSLCEVLDHLAKKRLLEKAGGDVFSADIRARAYRRAGSALKCVPFKLQTSKDVESLKSFGPRVLAVATEYLTTGVVAEAELLATDERLSAISAFQQLYGVGYSSARVFYDENGLRSVDQLRSAIQKEPMRFSEALVLYLSHYDDLRRTKRSDAEDFKGLVEGIANQPANNLHLRFTLCGGFRRGEPSGHDVDLLYCRRAERTSDHSSVLKELIDRLVKRGVIAEVLRLSSDKDGWGETHYHKRSNSFFPLAHDIFHGIAQFNGYKFRLDIVGVRDSSEFCFATLAWSGSTSFQRDIRLWCETQKKWTFGQHGLFHQESGQRVNLDPAPQSEMDVFAAIGLTYRPPYERSC